MFKLVVLSAVLAVVAARPGYLGGLGLGLAPVATSHSARVDIHSAPLIAAAPVVHAAPIIAAAPAIALPAAVSHSARYDIHRSAAIVTPAFAAPVVAAHAYAAPAVSIW